MSKRIKNLLADQFSQRLAGVDDALLVNVVGLDANQSVGLRRQLREKKIELMVVKNGLARRATEGTSLAPAMEGAQGSLAFVWGAEDFVSLVKEVNKLDEDDDFEAFKTRGGVMDGEQLTPERVKEISKWPNRAEQLSILSGQVCGPGSELAGAIVGPGGNIASQIKQKSEEEAE
ncbi:MAG: 50S ribosomal protein L10 [Pirellulaceae bacterium]|nr:50S ribosomal protein L10 [Pirellulaceae bacterium]